MQDMQKQNLEEKKKKKDSKAFSSKVKGKEKEEKDSSKKIVKKGNHFATMKNKTLYESSPHLA